MRLVGAANSYIRGPFIVTGIITGALSALLILLLLVPSLYYADVTGLGFGGYHKAFGFSLLAYYGTHFIFIFAVIAGSGVMLGAIASWLAVRRYLKV
jgi:cell division transport system permease protein